MVYAGSEICGELAPVSEHAEGSREISGREGKEKDRGQRGSTHTSLNEAAAEFQRKSGHLHLKDRGSLFKLKKKEKL